MDEQLAGVGMIAAIPGDVSARNDLTCLADCLIAGSELLHFASHNPTQDARPETPTIPRHAGNETDGDFGAIPHQAADNTVRDFIR